MSEMILEDSFIINKKNEIFSLMISIIVFLFSYCMAIFDKRLTILLKLVFLIFGTLIFIVSLLNIYNKLIYKIRFSSEEIYIRKAFMKYTIDYDDIVSYEFRKYSKHPGLNYIFIIFAKQNFKVSFITKKRLEIVKIFNKKNVEIK